MRIRWHRQWRQLLVHLLTLFVVLVKACQKLSWRLAAVVSVCVVLVWWMRAGQDFLCDGQSIQEQICREFAARDIAGDMCYDLCVTRLYRLSGCDSLSAKTFQILSNSAYMQGHMAVYQSGSPNLRPSVSLNNFVAMLTGLLQYRLDETPELDVLVMHLMDSFDFNRDAKLNYGEAQTLWKQLHQPHFLNNFLFQNSGVVPHLNGTCGALSIWSHGNLWSHLYTVNGLWPISLIYPKVFRMTLPSWPRRAKIILSLLELAEDLIETYGARFHLCNMSGESLYHDKNSEILISVYTQLMSSHEIKLALSNRSCHHNYDCIFTPQCQSKCHVSSHTCTGQLIRPTISFICDIIQDYLLFDAPKSLASVLTRRVRRCQKLWSYTANFHVAHSVIILDLKAMLWSHIQDMKL